MQENRQYIDGDHHPLRKNKNFFETSFALLEEDIKYWRGEESNTPKK
jgi:hypothetical protein